MRPLLCACVVSFVLGGCEVSSSVGAGEGPPTESGAIIAGAAADPASGDLFRKAVLRRSVAADRAAREQAFLDRPGPALAETGWATETALDQGTTSRVVRLYFGLDPDGGLSGQLQLSGTVGPARHRPDRVLVLRDLFVDPTHRKVEGWAGQDGELTFWLSWSPDRLTLSGRVLVRSPGTSFVGVRDVKLLRVGAPLWCEGVCLGRVCDASTSRCFEVAPEGSDIMCTSPAHCANGADCEQAPEGSFCGFDEPAGEPGA